MKIIFHWVGAGSNNINDNTYFLIQDWEDNLQVDCSGGMWLMRKVKYENFSFSNLFISHKHTDHILWFFHLPRNKELSFNLYCSKDVEESIRKVSEILWPKNNTFLERVLFINIDDEQEKNIWKFSVFPMNLHSDKIEQFWFMLFSNNKKIVFFWDEAVKVLKRDDLEKYMDADYLIIEAVCTHAMSKKWWGEVDTEKMHHITSKEAWTIASKLQAKNLILVHTMDIWNNREEVLKLDAQSEFNGNIIIPKGGDILEIE